MNLLERIVYEIINDNNLTTFENEAPIDIANAIKSILQENKQLKKEVRFLKNHEYTNICQCCKKEFYSKRPNVLWCRSCRTKMYNINYYANLSEEKRKERAEKSKLKMREIRSRKQIK